MAAKQAQFEVFRDRAGEYRWRLRAKNGLLIANGGEGYKTRGGITRALTSVRASVASAIVEDVAE
jgi:uncharacterized protein YegP (UPF0339 family)